MSHSNLNINMKKNLYNELSKVLFALCLGASVSGCSDFLETEPYDFVAPQTFYANENDCTMALAGIYYTLTYEEVYGNYYSCMISNVDDLSYYKRKAADTAGYVYGNDHGPSEKNIWGTWEALYKGINNANMLLENIDKADMDESVRTRIKGEARFLRAYFHFLLVQGWYEVPIRKSSTEDITSASLEATPHKEALDWIISEMEACVDMVDDSAYDKSPSYVKKNTVMGILARVNLWTAGYPAEGGKPYYEKAAYWANQVKISGKHDLNPDIYAIWKNMAADTYDTEYNESIWEAEFLGTRDDGNYTDGRIGNVIGNLQKCGTNPCSGYAYGFYAGTLILWDLFNEDDPRRDLSMAPYSIDVNDQKVYWRNEDVTTEAGNVQKAQIVERCCGKFRREWETAASKNKNWTPENYPILRYADVLLMLAEAENEVHNGPTALAYECLNRIRRRGNMPDLSSESYESFRQAVRDERARELCFESLRKYDLIRWGIYVKAVHDDLGEATTDARWATGNDFSGAKTYASRTQEKHQFLPIPTKELDVNGKLTQNKYWQGK